MSESATATRMRHDSAGRITHAALNYLQIALTNLYPDSMFAAAPVPEPPADWPLDVVLWKPQFDDPARMLIEASELLQLAYDLVVNESSFDDKAPTTSELDRLLRVERHAREVMEALERHGEGIVGHLLDNDDNSGEFLRRALSGEVPDAR